MNRARMAVLMMTGTAILSTLAWAAQPPAKRKPGSVEEATEVYSFPRQQISFISIPSQRLLISASCRSGDQWNCQAWQAIQSAGTKKAEPLVTDGKSPGTVVCESLFQGEIVIGLDQDRNERSFCRFSDQSLVDAGSLWHYAMGARR